MTPSSARGARTMSGRVPRLSIYSLVSACLLALLSGCHHSNPGVNSPLPVQKELWKEFSGDKAFEYTKAQVDFGPRPAGSEALAKTRDYLVENLKQLGWQVELQPFTDNTPKGPVKFVNLIARFPESPGKPASTTAQSVIICSHYDTKLFSMIKFVGASDGASSTGALLELARVLALEPALAQKIELVFFDGEEAVEQWNPDSDGTYGSRYFAKQLRDSNRASQFQFGILWDMIGKKNVTITLSTDTPPDMAKDIFAASDALNQRKHFTYFSQVIGDDHVPLIHIARITTIDLIDFDYMYWHTADDTLDKLSPDSLQVVGSVTLYYLQHRLAK